MLPISWKREIEESIEETERRNAEERKAAEREEKTDIAAQLAALVNQFHTEAEQRSRDQKTKYWSDGFTVLFVFLTALFTGLSWCAFREQVYEMKLAYDPIKESADAAKTSADAGAKLKFPEIR